MKKILSIIFLSLVMCSSVLVAGNSVSSTLYAYRGVSSLIINGKNTDLSSEALIIDNTTYVPVRLIADKLKKNIYWNPNTKNIYISDYGNINISENIAKDIAINTVGGGYVQMFIENIYEDEVPTYTVKVLHGIDKFNVVIDARDGTVIEFSRIIKND